MVDYKLITQKIVTAIREEDNRQMFKVTPIGETMWELSLLLGDGSHREVVYTGDELLCLYDVLRGVLFE